MRARLCLVILALILATNLPARAEEEEDDLGDELSEDEYVTIEEEEPVRFFIEVKFIDRWIY